MQHNQRKSEAGYQTKINEKSDPGLLDSAPGRPIGNPCLREFSSRSLSFKILHEAVVIPAVRSIERWKIQYLSRVDFKLFICFANEGPPSLFFFCTRIELG